MLTNILIISSFLAAICFEIVLFILCDQTNTQKIYDYKDFPDMLVISKSREFEVVTGVCLNLITTETNYLQTVRLQNRFSVYHIESQTGSLYILHYGLNLDQNWETLGEKRQQFYLDQAREHFSSFHSALTELSLCINTQPLTLDELQKEWGFKGQCRVTIDFNTPELDQIESQLPSDLLQDELASEKELHLSQQKERIEPQSPVLINEKV